MKRLLVVNTVVFCSEIVAFGIAFFWGKSLAWSLLCATGAGVIVGNLIIESDGTMGVQDEFLVLLGNVVCLVPLFIYAFFPRGSGHLPLQIVMMLLCGAFCALLAASIKDLSGIHWRFFAAFPVLGVVFGWPLYLIKSRRSHSAT